MGRRIGVLNYKGGTGKTTTVVNLAAALALSGVRVLCIDLDAQGSLATCLGVEYTHTLAHLLLGQVGPEACVVQARDNLDVIASDSSLIQVEGAMWRMNDNRLARQMLNRGLRGLDRMYDFVLLDFSPSASIVSDGGLRYAEELIVPVSTSYLALIGTRQVIETLKHVGRIPGHNVRFYLVLPTFFNRGQRQDREILSILRQHFGDRVAEPIRSSVRLTEAPSHRETIFEYAPRGRGSSDYMRLADRVLADG
jgi:chromosome partitioning protein